MYFQSGWIGSMDKNIEERVAITPDLQDLLKHMKEEIDTTLLHSRRVMLMDIITHINSLTRDTYYMNKELYSRLMIIFNIAMKSGKVYLDELKFA